MKATDEYLERRTVFQLTLFGSMGNKSELLFLVNTRKILLSFSLQIFFFSGSGKKALLDVISRRVQGPTRGQILLNNQPMSLPLFQQRCGYVTHKCDFLPGLTVEQTLNYTPTKVSHLLSLIEKH